MRSYIKIVVAIDSFKGSLSSFKAGNAVKESIIKLDSTANVVGKSIADGGEGIVDALASELGSEIIKTKVKGPLLEELEKDIMDADIVVTGEGLLDAQTIMGKAPIGVSKLAKNTTRLLLLFVVVHQMMLKFVMSME